MPVDGAANVSRLGFLPHLDLPGRPLRQSHVAECCYEGHAGWLQVLADQCAVTLMLAGLAKGKAISKVPYPSALPCLPAVAGFVLESSAEQRVFEDPLGLHMANISKWHGS